MLANDVPTFRSYLLSPQGIPLLINNVKGLATANPPVPMLDLCAALSHISHFSWSISSVPLDVCPFLSNLLMYVLNPIQLTCLYLTFCLAPATATANWVTHRN